MSKATRRCVRDKTNSGYRSAQPGYFLSSLLSPGANYSSLRMSDSRELEILVAKIQAQLAPDAEVVHDVKLEGRQSRRPRQIDVLVRQKIGQYEMVIVLDCK